MNPDTGLIQRLRRGEQPPEGTELLPKALAREATRALHGQPSTVLDLRRKGPLQNWAKKKRKAKIAAASRRRNRK